MYHIHAGVHKVYKQRLDPVKCIELWAREQGAEGGDLIESPVKFETPVIKFGEIHSPRGSFKNLPPDWPFR
jgi:hypothetical protein